MELCLLVPADPVAFFFFFSPLLFLTHKTLNGLGTDSLRAHLICQGSFVADSVQCTKLQYSGFSPAHLPSPMSKTEKESREGWSQTNAKGLRRSSSARASCDFSLD